MRYNHGCYLSALTVAIPRPWKGADPMKEAALLDVPFAKARDTSAAANAKAREFIPLAKEAIENAIDLPAKIRAIWDGLRRATQRGQVEAARAVTGAFLHNLEQCFSIVRDAQLLADYAAQLGCKPLPRADQLTTVFSDLESLRHEALAGWPYQLPGPVPATSLAPVWMDEHSDIYAGRSHVLLDTIIEEFKAGTSPEDIASGYDTLQPADVHEVISYYLRYCDVVDAYLKRREVEAEELRQKIEVGQPSKAELRAQIKERWSRRKAADASPAE